jgi:hypothetical protein
VAPKTKTEAPVIEANDREPALGALGRIAELEQLADGVHAGSEPRREPMTDDRRQPRLFVVGAGERPLL